MSYVLEFIQSNKKISSLKGKELKSLIEELLITPLDYREIINLDPNTTIGIEIEYEEADREKLTKYLQSAGLKWDSKNDGSLHGGGEVTSPIMRNEKEYWQQVKQVCNYLKSKGAIANDRTGGHIHFGSDIFHDDYNKLARFQALFGIYENILFRFAAGEFDRLRNGQERYAPGINEACVKYYNKNKLSKSDFNDVGTRLHMPCSTERRNALNLTNLDFSSYAREYKNTVEIRLSNGTIEETIWQNNISTFGNLLEYAVSPECDTEFIDFKIKQLKENGYEDYIYQELCLKDALEFADLIFDNNLDKLYFLRQYLKDFTTVEPKKEIEKVNRFIK